MNVSQVGQSSQVNASPERRRGARRPHPLASRLLVVLGTVLLLAGIVIAWANWNVYSDTALARHTHTALQDEAVQTVLADRLVNAVVSRGNPRLIPAKPVLDVAAQRLVASPRFADAVSAAVMRIHHLIFTTNLSTNVVNVTERASALRQRVATISPTLAQRIPPNLTVTLTTVHNIGQAVNLAKQVHGIATVLSVLFLILALVLFAVAAWLAPHVGVGGRWIGIGVGLAGFLILVMLQIGERVVTGAIGDPTVESAATATVGTFTASLHSAALLLVGIGIVLIALSIVLPPGAVTGVPQHALASTVTTITAEPSTTSGRIIRAVVLAGAGVLVLVYWQQVVPLAIAALGIGLAFWGAMAILGLFVRPTTDGAGLAVSTGRKRTAAGIVGIVVVVLFFLVVHTATS
jgi:hypothetical protein